jgi:hypothetical protein
MRTSNGIAEAPAWRQNRWRILAASLVVALIVAALIVLVMGSGERGPQRAARASGQQPTSRSTPASNRACRASGSDPSIPDAPPSDFAWKNVGALLVPTSRTYGPARYAGPVWSCYSHTPMGAVMAAYGIFGTLAGPGWRAVAEQEIAPGRGRQAFIDAGLNQSYRPLSSQEAAQPAGFTVVSYTAAQATIETLSDSGNGLFQTEQLTVTWQDGDWKLVLTPQGTVGPDPQVVSSDSGFVLWGQ